MLLTASVPTGMQIFTVEDILVRGVLENCLFQCFVLLQAARFHLVQAGAGEKVGISQCGEAAAARPN